MNVTREQKLQILDIAIDDISKVSYISMCTALWFAANDVLGNNTADYYRDIFPKYNRFNYFLKNPCWSVVKTFIHRSQYWDTMSWQNDKDGTIRAAKRRVKFLEYLKTTV